MGLAPGMVALAVQRQRTPAVPCPMRAGNTDAGDNPLELLRYARIQRGDTAVGPVARYVSRLVSLSGACHGLHRIDQGCVQIRG